ncbi:MAG: UDP-N-acetylglucosamine--N-acetylmuramyl-(pentapeptide) pyrophosphoryl-undecaprenol N-acetylglucosamine transferase [Candidatus Levybacteria bacterium]|nr:UDP-N-acetylglucosamine--N-acetylmuramyl-(pentapeptide) pyrophosphoryl-undecaprenol N-acetylglucosamine transferase [Candidatus Levybacteria bacterium]
MKIVIVGGHLSPALAIIDALPEGVDVRFIGRKTAVEGDQSTSLEYREITSRNISFFPLTTARVQRSLSRHTFPSIIRLPIGMYQAVEYLRREKPDVVLSFGGYLSVPVGFAAKILGIPLVIHEQTFHVGLANKVLSSFASRICISWESSKKYFPQSKTVLTGNPMRKFEMKNFPYVFSTSDEKLPLVYITGGSTGSHVINVLVEESIKDLLTSSRVIHQTGDTKEFGDYDKLNNFRKNLTEKEKGRYIIEKFIKPDTTGIIMKNADLVVSRAGMNTITELLYFETPALLIPLQTGQKNEQILNAKFFASLDVGENLFQKGSSGKNFYMLLTRMLSELSRYQKGFEKAHKLIIEDAAKQVIAQMFYVVKKKTS